jgi:hypothetical protein
MLTTDSVTVAVEVPITLTREDVTHMQTELGFAIPLEMVLSQFSFEAI